jgi:tetratricopeptide (TPR) repeat protein
MQTIDSQAKSPTAGQDTANLPELINQAVAFHRKGGLAEAEALYLRILQAKPDHFDAQHLLGTLRNRQGRHAEAVELIGKALRIEPNHAEAYLNLGNALLALKRPAEAVESYDKAIALRPDYAEAFYNRGNALKELARVADAVASYDKAIAFKPQHAKAHYNRGNALLELRRTADAVASYDRAIAVKPDYVEAFYNRGNALNELKRADDAVASYERAIALNPGHVQAHYNRANSLVELRRVRQAAVSYDKALALNPDHKYALSGLAYCATRLCDWPQSGRLAPQLRAHVAEQRSIIAPFALLGYTDEPALQLQCAKTFVRDRIGQAPRPLWSGQTWRNDRIKVAYLSANFRQHAVAYQTAELFERHDRARFETIGISFGPDDQSELRERLGARGSIGSSTSAG